MRFTCDSCGAQYMISDEKVGAGGVKVRCKRCGHVIVVKGAPAAPPVVEPAPPAPDEAPPPAEPRPGAAEAGLDLELGQAFENVFGGGSLAAGADGTGAPAAPPAEGGGEEAPPPPEGETEWYVAVNDAQVGPLLPAGVKARWESGEIGPDTLAWKSGMGDWEPLSAIPELAQLVAPLPRPAGRPAPAPVPVLPAAEPVRAAAPAPAPEPEPGWKPSAASALAALASEELASMAKPAPPPAAAPAGSLVEKMALPEGGIEPTGMMPLHLKGVESTAETLLTRRPEAPARPEVTAVRELRKSSNRRLVGIVALLCALFGGAVAALYVWMNPRAAAPDRVPVAARSRTDARRVGAAVEGRLRTIFLRR